MEATLNFSSLFPYELFDDVGLMEKYSGPAYTLAYQTFLVLLPVIRCSPLSSALFLVFFFFSIVAYSSYHVYRVLIVMASDSAARLAEAVLQADGHPFATLSLAEGLPPVTASTEVQDARRNYIKIASMIHPDKLKIFSRATEAFQCLVRAFECFADPKKRQEVSRHTARGNKAAPKADRKRTRAVKEPTTSKKAKPAGKGRRPQRTDEDDDDDGEGWDAFLHQDEPPAVSTSRKPIGEPRVGGVYRETLIGCPQCGSRWEPDSKPQYSLFMGKWGRKAHCQLCLCRFGSATARHSCPHCEAPFTYDASMYDQTIKCKGKCKKTFGFPYFPVNQALIDQIALDEWKLQKEKEKASERDRRAAARSGRGKSAVDPEQERLQLTLGACIMDSECPICGKRVTAKHRTHPTWSTLASILWLVFKYHLFSLYTHSYINYLCLTFLPVIYCIAIDSLLWGFQNLKKHISRGVPILPSCTLIYYLLVPVCMEKNIINSENLNTHSIINAPVRSNRCEFLSQRLNKSSKLVVTESVKRPLRHFTLLVDWSAYLSEALEDSCPLPNMTSTARPNGTPSFANEQDVPGEICVKGDIKRMFSTPRGLDSVPPPSWEVLPANLLYDDNHMPRPEVVSAHFRREGLLAENDAIDIIMRCAMIWKSEPNVMRLRGDTIVSGDIHGQFFDLLTLLELGGSPAQQQYLFLGDYVDRGCFGMEAVLLLMTYKICYPQRLVMLRGNHESRHLTAYFNFKREVEYKYTAAVYNAMVSAFDCLPLTCIVDDRFFCVHGGLSPELKTIADINALHRFREPPSSGPMCDLLWSDPLDEREADVGGANSLEASFIPNTTRGCSYVFSHGAAVSFLETNKMLTLIRGHEAQAEGFRLYRNGPKGFPSVICLFSAPNYCDTYDNRAAVLSISEGVLKLRQFNSSPHPYYLPNFMNAFMWSLNFAVDKLMDIWTGVLQVVDKESDERTNPQGHLDVQACSDSIREKLVQLNSLDDSDEENDGSDGDNEDEISERNYQQHSLRLTFFFPFSFPLYIAPAFQAYIRNEQKPNDDNPVVNCDHRSQS
eukprot:gene4005-2860_t